MELAQTLAIIVTVIAANGFVWREMNRRFDRVDDRLEHLYDVLREHGERIARLETHR